MFCFLWVSSESGNHDKQAFASLVDEQTGRDADPRSLRLEELSESPVKHRQRMSGK